MAVGNRCSRCWMPLGKGRCSSCAEQLPSFASLRSGLRYEGEAQRLVQAFKFKDQTALAADLGRLLASQYLKIPGQPEAVVPVPLTGVRRRQRGYNQALLLARELASITGLPVLEALQRRTSTRSQSQAADADERRRNVATAFSMKRGLSVSGLSLLLIDDVATTGATLDACARVLLESGASRVDALTLARED